MFNIGDLKKCEDNTELGTILLEEGENDPIMVPQTNTKANTNHNWINTNKPPGVALIWAWLNPLTQTKKGISNLDQR